VRPWTVGAHGGRGVGGVVQLGSGRWALELVGELPSGGIYLLVALGDLHGEANGAPVLLDGPLEGLTDPPGGVGGEPEAALPIELVDGTHQAEGALLDEVGEVDATVLVASCPVDHEAEVGRHHLPTGHIVADGDSLGQLGLGIVVGQRVVIEVTKEQPHAVGF